MRHPLAAVLFVIFILVVLLTACSSKTPAPSPAQDAVATAAPRPVKTVPPASAPVDLSSPEAVLKSSFAALEANDMNAYIDTLDPDTRSRPNSPASVGTILSALTGIKVETGQLSFRNMNYEPVQQDGDWAWMRVTGQGRILSLATENAIDEVIMTRRINGKWYVSDETAYVNSPEGMAKKSAAATATWEAQAASATATVSAEMTAVAAANESIIAGARQAVSDQDWYNAAAELQTVLANQPVNEAARKLLAEIQPHVPGALVTQFGCYYRFNDTPFSRIPVVNEEAHDRVDAYAVDGKRAVVNQNYVDPTSGKQLSREITNGGQCLSPNLTYGVNTYRLEDKGVQAEDLLTKQVFNALKIDSIHRILHLCWVQDSDLPFLDDETVWIPRDSPQGLYFVLWNVKTGEAQDVRLPGLTDEIRVYLSPDRKLLYIAAGDKILSSGLDGSNIRTVATLPPEASRFAASWSDPNRILSDGTSLYVFPDHIVSLRTGRVSTIPLNEYRAGVTGDVGSVVAWTNNPVTANKLTAVQTELTVAPAEGPRGTEFKFALPDLPVGWTVTWTVTNPGQKVVASGENIGLNSDGTGNPFGYQPDLSSEIGTYTVTVMAGPAGSGQQFSASFSVNQ